MCHTVSQVHLPLQELSECHYCHRKPERASLCSSCGEAVYCSAACQRSHWSMHKLHCGRTERISLEKFYPYLAWMYDSANTFAKPLHVAIAHGIVNAPNPETPPILFPDGWEARMVIVDDTKPPISFTNEMDWFPRALSPPVARKLQRRIQYEGYLLPAVTSVAAAILFEMYTSTSAAKSEDTRLRLQYRSSPISDFGIATGSVDVKNQDKLGYYMKSDGSTLRGQDPNDHYWIYFTTVRGEYLVLDCGMYTFNMCVMVDCMKYRPPGMSLMHSWGQIPAFFWERTLRKNAPRLHTERQRMSMLRDPKLQELVKTGYAPIARSPDPDVEISLAPFVEYMEALSWRRIKKCELEVFSELFWNQIFILHRAICPKKSFWKSFPAEPPIGIETDPGETVQPPDSYSGSAKKG